MRFQNQGEKAKPERMKNVLEIGGKLGESVMMEAGLEENFEEKRKSGYCCFDCQTSNSLCAFPSLWVLLV